MKLFLDTTRQDVNITVFDQQIHKTFTYRGNNDHTTTIYNHLTQIDLSTITAVYVTNGPGSYTGVRLGVLVAKTIACELNIKLFVINTLDLFYCGLNIPVALDARGKQYFTYNGSEYSKTSYDDCDGYHVIDEAVNSEWLLDSNIIDKFTNVDPLTVTIEYMKDAI